MQLQREAVGNIAKTYLKIVNLSNLVAVAWDPKARSPRWTHDLAHYRIDVERCLTRAFADREDRKALEEAWDKFVDNEAQPQVIDATTARMLRILSANFERAELNPKTYFQNPRCYRTKPEGRASA